MTTPTISIGLPVFNGDRFVARAIGSLLVQTRPDFELVVSDNGSTDGTEAICRDLAGRDERIRYLRHDRNRGASWNFGHVLEQAHPGARFFAWAAADDEHGEHYLEQTAEILERDETVALANTASADIDEDGYVLKVWHQPVEPLRDPRPHVRLGGIVTMRHECFDAFGLIRHEVARATRGLGPFSDADNVLLAEIALRGRFEHTADVQLFRRQHAERSVRAYPDERRRAEWFALDRRGSLSFPSWRVGRELLAAIDRAPLSPAERRRCRGSLLVFARHNWSALASDVIRSGSDVVDRMTADHRPAADLGPVTRGPA